jgi:hypothetical protein
MDISSASTDCTIQKEYPSSTFLGSGAVAIADGNGLLYVLPIKDDPGLVEPVAIFTLRTEGVVNAPFRIHYSHRLSPVLSVLLLSSRHYPDNSDRNLKAAHSQIEFDVWAVQINSSSFNVEPGQQDLQVLWHRRGQDVPIYTTFVEAVNAYLLIGGSSYPDLNTAFARHYEPPLEEMVPIPREGENPDTFETSDESENPPKPHAYSWMQTPDTLMVAFPLPSSTPKTSIKVIFTMQTLTVTVDTHHLAGGESPIPIPHYVTKALWDNVDPSACFWTWDREAEHAYGLLTLHMEKKNEGTRWMQVFASSAVSTGDPQGNDDREVPESVDPSEMVKIREALEKWTASISSGEDASGFGLGKGVPSLMEGEIDEEADAQVGRKAWLTWVGEGGQTLGWNMKASTGDEKQKYWEAPPVTLLSTPFPGTVSTSGEVELLLKYDIDGTIFSFKTTDSAPVWKHTSTYPALAFVLASKRDTRFTHHLSSRGVFALEGGSLRDRGANLYIYRPSGKKEKWAKQSVLRVDDGSGGAVLGVGCITVDSGKAVVIVCLTEKELVLIRDI